MGCASSSTAESAGEIKAAGISEAQRSGAPSSNGATSNEVTPQKLTSVQITPKKPTPVQVTAVEELDGIEQSPIPGKKTNPKKTDPFTSKPAATNGEQDVQDIQDEANRLRDIRTDQEKQTPFVEEALSTSGKQQSSFTGVVEMPFQIASPTAPAPSFKQTILPPAESEQPQLEASPAEQQSQQRQQEQRQSQPHTNEEQQMGQQVQVQVEVEPPPPDPWASLQSQYQMRASAEFKPSSSGQKGPVGGNFNRGGKAHSSNNNRFVKAGELVVDSDGEEMRPPSQNQGLGNQGKSRSQRKQLPPVSGPKTGGWGQGSLAAAGTLMLGDEDDILANKGSTRSTRRIDDVDIGMEEDNGLPSPSTASKAAKSKVVEDMGMEDIEDVDALLAAESENGGLNKDLAAKLKAFEAMNDDDD